jgi:hypothetical protein
MGTEPKPWLIRLVDKPGLWLIVALLQIVAAVLKWVDVAQGTGPAAARIALAVLWTLLALSFGTGWFVRWRRRDNAKE